MSGVEIYAPLEALSLGSPAPNRVLRSPVHALYIISTSGAARAGALLRHTAQPEPSCFRALVRQQRARAGSSLPETASIDAVRYLSSVSPPVCPQEPRARSARGVVLLQSPGVNGQLGAFHPSVHGARPVSRLTSRKKAACAKSSDRGARSDELSNIRQGPSL